MGRDPNQPVPSCLRCVEPQGHDRAELWPSDSRLPRARRDRRGLLGEGDLRWPAAAALLTPELLTASGDLRALGRNATAPRCSDPGAVVTDTPRGRKYPLPLLPRMRKTKRQTAQRCILFA